MTLTRPPSPVTFFQQLRWSSTHSTMFCRYAATAFPVLIALVSCTPPPTKPNVVIFLADDAGYADFGFQGNELYITPNLDQIANNGTHFTNAYVTASVCSPSRAGLLTGRYQNRFGFEFNLFGMETEGVTTDKMGLPESELTLADLMREVGYATGIVGKWGLGRRPHHHPRSRGFDEFFGFIGDHSAYLPGKAVRLSDGDETVDYKQLGYLTDVFGDKAVDFIERHKNGPFFLFVSFNAPHAPMQARSDYLKTFQKVLAGRRATNAAMTRSMDDNVGRVLNKIKQLGLYENTIVIFTNDNGGAADLNGSSNAPLRGDKGSVFEGGIRAPLLIQWPSELSGGRTVEFPVSMLDVLPTLLAAAGGSLPVDRKYDGVDLMPYLTGSAETDPHSTLFWRVNWAAAAREGRWKLIRTPRREHLLYDLDADVGETTDVSAQHPEVVRSMVEQLNTWEATLASPLWLPNIMWKEKVLTKYDHDYSRSDP